MPRTPAFGSITGIVRGPNGAALDAACVTAVGKAGPVTVHTGSTGRYFLTGLRPGAYAVRYADCGAPARSLPQWYGGSLTASGAAHVLVLAGRPIWLKPVSLHPIRLTMATAAQQYAMRRAAALATGPGTISGIVRAPSGRPLAGICVTLWYFTPNSGQGFGIETARNGTYSIEPGVGGLPDHGLRLEFTAGQPGCSNNGNYAPQWWKDVASESKSTPLAVKPGHHIRNVDARMKVGGEISGVVRAAGKSGQPLRGICVTASPATFNQFDLAFLNMAFTGSNGHYLISALGTGSYDLTFQSGAECGSPDYGNGGYLDYNDPHAVHVVAGKRVSVDVVMHLGGVIAGVVSEGSTGVAGACVDLAEGGLQFGQFPTGANGIYSIPKLVPGRYQVGFSGGCGNKGSLAPQYYPDEQNAAEAKTLTIGSGQTVSGIDASLLPGATISGSVTTAIGKPIANFCVEPVSQHDVGLFVGGILPLVTSESGLGGHTGNKGTYTVANLASGSFYLDFFSCDATSNLASDFYSPPGQTAPGEVSAVAGSVTSGIDMVIGPGGAITGTVRTPAGKPDPEGCVTVVPAVSSPVAGLESAAYNASANGTYVANELQQGSYKVEFGSCGAASYAPIWYGGASFVASAKTVHVRAGRTTANISGTLLHGQSITGQVISGVTRKPIRGLCVNANDPQGNFVTFGFTGRTGKYIVTSLSPGSYTLQFTPCQLAVVATIASELVTPAHSSQVAASKGPALAPITRANVKVGRRRPTTGINAVLRPGGYITGSILAGAGPVAQPGTCVLATPVTGNGEPEAAATGPAGAYRIGALAAGSYRLLFTADCLIGTAALAPQLDPSLVKVTPPGTLSGVNATLASDGQITGTVTNQASTAVAGVCVTAQPVAQGASSLTSVTGNAGTYSIPDLTPGGYTVRFTTGCGATGYQTQWWDDAISASGATPVPVPSGGTQSGIDAKLVPTP